MTTMLPRVSILRAEAEHKLRDGVNILNIIREHHIHPANEGFVCRQNTSPSEASALNYQVRPVRSRNGIVILTLFSQAYNSTPRTVISMCTIP